MTKAVKITIEKDHVLCREGVDSHDLYLITQGKLLICSRSGKMVTPIAYISDNEYFGEMSFFDNQDRSADVIALEKTELLKIPSEALKEQFPNWLLMMTRSMTKKLRLMDGVIRDKGIKRRNVESLKPLTIEEQRKFYQLLAET